MRRRIKYKTKGKTAVKHSHTLVQIIGNGSQVGTDTIYQTSAGDRSLDGSEKVIQDSGTTGAKCQVGDLIKYVTVHLQSAITQEGETAFTQGWIEWAIVFRNEVFIPIPTTNLGIQTLGDIATQMFRGDCILTGCFPVSLNLPNCVDIPVKIPDKAQTLKLGSNLDLYTIFRDANTTDIATNTIKLLNSYNFKVYN